MREERFEIIEDLSHVTVPQVFKGEQIEVGEIGLISIPFEEGSEKVWKNVIGKKVAEIGGVFSLYAIQASTGIGTYYAYVGEGYIPSDVFKTGTSEYREEFYYTVHWVADQENNAIYPKHSSSTDTIERYKILLSNGILPDTILGTDADFEGDEDFNIDLDLKKVHFLLDGGYTSNPDIGDKVRLKFNTLLNEVTRVEDFNEVIFEGKVVDKLLSKTDRMYKVVYFDNLPRIEEGYLLYREDPSSEQPNNNNKTYTGVAQFLGLFDKEGICIKGFTLGNQVISLLKDGNLDKDNSSFLFKDTKDFILKNQERLTGYQTLILDTFMKRQKLSKLFSVDYFSPEKVFSGKEIPVGRDAVIIPDHLQIIGQVKSKPILAVKERKLNRTKSLYRTSDLCGNEEYFIIIRNSDFTEEERELRFSGLDDSDLFKTKSEIIAVMPQMSEKLIQEILID